MHRRNRGTSPSEILYHVENHYSGIHQYFGKPGGNHKNELGFIVHRYYSQPLAFIFTTDSLFSNPSMDCAKEEQRQLCSNRMRPTDVERCYYSRSTKSHADILLTSYIKVHYISHVQPQNSKVKSQKQFCNLHEEFHSSTTV